MDNSEFTFVTYNLDSQTYNFEERLNSFLEKIKADPPDVVVVQEGRRLTYEKLIREMGLLGYKRHLLDVMSHRNTGEVIFSKFPMSNIEYVNFPGSTENRGITYAKIDMWGVDNIWVCTSQLDFGVGLSRTQVKKINHTLKDIPKTTNLIFGGDTRISEYQSDLSQPNGWCDAWYEAGTESERYTYDSSVNLLVSPPYKDRPDRVWFRPSTSEGSKTLECVGCKLYGNDSPTAISSHYGVWVKFRLVSED